MTQHPDLFAALAAPFDSHEVKARQSSGGRQIQYVTARTVMNRLDDVLGPERWWDDYQPLEHSVICRLTVQLPDGSTVTKSDAGGYAGMADQGDDDKSGFSDAFKRAAAKFGVARYLYRDGVPAFARERISEPVTTEPAPAPTRDRAQDRPRDRDQSPRTGKALFAWAKQQEERHGVALLKYLNNLGKLHEHPSRMIDWDADQVALAYAEAIRKLQAGRSAREDAREEALAN